VGEILAQLRDALSGGGFLEDERFREMKDARHRAFAEAPCREPIHAGSSYPADREAVRDLLTRHLPMEGGPVAEPPATAAARADDGLLGIAAPHVSPEGGWPAYRAAYARLGPRHRERTVVVLGTSHYGAPERFGLTRKPFATPLGRTTVDVDLVDELAKRGGDAVVEEDYCHAVEHSIEFQVLFLQHVLGPDVRILPVLCGPFARATRDGGRPEDDPEVGRFLDALAHLADREGRRLLWVLGVDMAHVGRRYGDSFAALAHQGRLATVERRDAARIDRLTRADAAGFWALVQQGGDDLRWCGASPLYCFLTAARPAGGELLLYQQWNIDPASVVSFAGVAFRRNGAA
jgi:AmmeMemoRadiSam system protein B